MTTTERDKFIERLGELGHAFGVDLPPARIAIYCSRLDSYKLRHLQAACEHFEIAGCAWRFPTVPEFHKLASKISTCEKADNCICCGKPPKLECGCTIYGPLAWWCEDHLSCIACCKAKHDLPKLQEDALDENIGKD